MKRQSGLTSLEEVAATPNGLFDLPICDYLSNAPTATEDVYTFKRGGASGTTLGVLTVVFTSSAKETVSSATWVPA